MYSNSNPMLKHFKVKKYLDEIEPIDSTGKSISFAHRQNLKLNENRPVCIYKQIFEILVWCYILYIILCMVQTIKALLKL